MSTSSSSSKSSGPNICRIIIQQCVSAQLSFDTNDLPVAIGRGMVVYVCFLQGATETSIENIAKTILETKLCEPALNPNTTEAGPTPRRISPLEIISSIPTDKDEDDEVVQVGKTDSNFDILLIPQATLCGKLKGKAMQYHGLIGKPEGLQLFMKLVETLRQQLKQKKTTSLVNHGVYGARQILKMETNGPFTHIFDF